MKRLLIVGLLALAASLLLAACGGGGAQDTPYNPAVTPLTGADLENVLTIANESGVTPCGAFNVNGHGPKVVDLSQYPSCSGTSFGVSCLDANAKWTHATVTDLKTVGSQVTFTSNQDGTCGLFAKP